MRRGVAVLLPCLLSAALGVASARASGAGTTTTSTTTTTTTTTTPAPSYAPLSNSSLPSGCVGAGAAAVVPPSHSVVALGTPATNLGPSGYPASASVVAFNSSTASGSTCRRAQVTLAAVSLFGGAVTATSVAATDGKGVVSGLEIDGTAVSVAAGQTVAVESWGQLTLGATVGRVKAPLVIRLLQVHDGLLAGTSVAVAFAAAPEPVARLKSKPKHHSAPSSHASQKTPSKSQGHEKAANTKKHRHRQPQKPPPDFPTAPDPVLAGGELADVAQDNPVVSIAAQYLGVPYQWGGAKPKTGFDCSGLVKYVFAQLGVSLPHYAASQWHSPDGVWVAPNRLQPGDLVFFTGSDGTRKAPGHVGIYAGDGYLIDAPHTGAFVEVDSLDSRWFANHFVGARRIVSPLHEVRHLLHVTRPGASPAAFHFGFPLPIRIALAGESVGVAAAGTTVVRTPSGGHWIWLGVALGGTLLLLLLAGGVRFRRRRSLDVIPSSDPSN